MNELIICRVCESADDLRPLFEEDDIMPHKLMSCANIEVLENDGLPQNICGQCMQLLELSYNFKLQCEKVDNKLRLFIANMECIEESTQADLCIPEFAIAIVNDCDDNLEKVDSSAQPEEENRLSPLKNRRRSPRSRLLRKYSRRAGIKIPKSPKQYPCAACSEVFDDYKKWLEHRRTHGPPRYPCDVCNKVFSKNSYLNKHKKAHEDINEIRTHECKVCFKKYISKGNLHRHMRAHTGDLRHVCDICGKRFIQSTTLRSHQLTHSDTREYSCKDCDKTFKSEKYLMLHREKSHSESNTSHLFYCDICGRRFINERNLKWHISNHIKIDSKTENKTVRKSTPRDCCCVCTYCGKTFKQKTQLQIHQRIHTGEKPYECEICQKKFGFQASYKFHMNSHTGERPFACNLCDMRFKQPTHLRNHKQIHTGIKPHQCTFCGKSFASKSNMKVHVRIHTGERPYVCNECGHAFVDSNGLKKHCKKHIT